jgi:hypothetical protein
MIKKVFLFFVTLVFLIGIISAIGECKFFGEIKWCCDETGHVFCNPDDPSVCGSPDWCANFNNPQLSCIPGEDWCCYNSGYVADYSSHKCCPPTHPFYEASSNNCWDIRIPTADNYYTRLSECNRLVYINSHTSVENKCVGAEFFICAENKLKKFVDGWESSGVIIGKCGAECKLDKDCPKDIISKRFCSGNDIMETRTDNSCLNYQCSTSIQDVFIETCSYQCQDVVGGGAVCIDKICDAGEKMCNEDGNVLICSNNQWTAGEECPYGCEEGACKSFYTTKSFFNILLISFSLLIILIVIMIILVRRKK